MIYRLTGVQRDYAWGSPTAIPQLLGQTPGDDPVAELWFGTHSSGSATVADGAPLSDLVDAAPEALLGAETVHLHGPQLPYLLKLIAPAQPLSLQVHPNAAQARRGFDAEEAAGLALDSPARRYRDRNHKPELVYAVTRFEALCGFRAPRRVLELLAGLDSALARQLEHVLHRAGPLAGMRAAFDTMLRTGVHDADSIDELVAACRARPAETSPSPRIDRIVAQLGEHYPGDGGAVAPLLLNPVTLEPGETLFVPPGSLHAYLSGVAVEVMANSDNVARAGLTAKHVDAEAVIDLVDLNAAPPMRIAAEPHGPQRTFYAPVDDFELSVLELSDSVPIPVRGRGPRILLGLSGSVTIGSWSGSERIGPGQAVFVADSEGELKAAGPGRCVQAAVP
ncbi:MAG: mannose-6-phosphate isomerase, class I [Beutenbergiaceae bacterium]